MELKTGESAKFLGLLSNVFVMLLLETMIYDEDDEYDEESEPEEPIYNRQELIEKYHVSNLHTSH